jgi:hypothetical protein
VSKQEWAEGIIDWIEKFFKSVGVDRVIRLLVGFASVISTGALYRIAHG